MLGPTRQLAPEVRNIHEAIEQARFQKGDYSKVEERLRVLERIATDSNHALASQIDELRALDAVEDKREPAS